MSLQLFKPSSSVSSYSQLSLILFIMSLKTFFGNEDLFEIISEEQINLLQLREVGSSLTLIVHIKDKSNYFTMIHGPIYTNLVKYLWKYAFVRFVGCFIPSCVFGVPIIITPSSIAGAISCVETCVTIEQFHL